MAGSPTQPRASDASVIDRFLGETWGQRFAADTTFGHGRAAEGFVEVLRRPEFWLQPLQKAFSSD